ATALTSDVRKTYVFFPDRGGVTAQGWDAIWQGTIISPRFSGVLMGNQLQDGGGGFCSNGVLAGDLVTLTGCADDSQCPLGMSCYRDPTKDQVPGGLTVTGLCLPANLKNSLAGQCAALAATVRRYEVIDARETQLTLGPHLDELVRSSLSPCHVVNDTVGISGAAGTSGAGGT